MASETATPNIGLQIPAFDQGNWQVPTNYNWNLLDLIFGGEVTVPALAVTNFIITNIGLQMANSFVTEVPAGVVPGNSYTLANVPTVLFGFYWNGIFQRPGLDYTLSGATITFTVSATSAGDTVYAVYMK
jgi:hypothetical protein